MTWAAKRQIIYFSVFMTLVILLIGIPLFALYYKAPTCFDNKQNGGETGVDCGGSCTRLCKETVTQPVVSWQQAFEVEPGLYSAVAYIQNPNLNAVALNVPYTFTFHDKNDAVVGERKGTTFIPPGKNFAVFESNISLPKDIGTVHTSFAFTGDFDWLNASSSPGLLIQNQDVEGISNSPTVTADIQNPSQKNLGRVDVVAIVYDTQGNAVAASKTYIDSLPKQSSAKVAFTWPEPFNGQVTSCQQPTDVVLDIDRSGSMSADGKNPPEPLTTVKNAALTFINSLTSKDKAAVISFATSASDPLDQVLTDDKASLKDAISSIEISKNGTQYTNIYDALQKSIAELTSGRQQSNGHQAIVLLTDGIPNLPEQKGDTQYPTDVALSAARDAQSRGISIYTIGLGKDVDDDFLKSIAGADERYFKAPSAIDLQSVYSQIGSALCKLAPAKVEIIPDVVPQ